MKTTTHLTPSRVPGRAHFDSETIYPILDKALYCTVSYAIENRPFSIPTTFVRIDNHIYIHGSVGSHFLREIEKGIPVCIAVTLINDLVIAKSAVHYSMNYSSVIVFDNAEKIDDPGQKMNAFKALTNKIIPDSWDYLRPARDKEVKKTTILRFEIKEASAKIRTGMANDDIEDHDLPIWSGRIPLELTKLKPIPDDYSQNIPLPKHLD